MQLIAIVRNLNTMRFYLIVCITACSFLSFGQGSLAPKYSNEFLAIGIGADALGLSNAVVAQTSGVNSGYWNPAGLARRLFFHPMRVRGMKARPARPSSAIAPGAGTVV